MHATRTLLLCSLGLTLGALASTAQAVEDKTLKLYNWADYFAEDTIAKFEYRYVEGTSSKVINCDFFFLFTALI